MQKGKYMEKLIMIFEDRLSKWGAYIISMPLFLMAIIETLNAIGRKIWVPFPCALESVENLLVMTVYLGASIVALERGHVQVDFIARKLPPSVRNYIGVFGNLLGAAAFGLLSWGAWKIVIHVVRIMEVRLGVYSFPLWPFKVLFAVGLTLLVVQLLINAIKLIYASSGRSNDANIAKIREGETPF
jgi:TRAP-type C4-dicarboxylate transport system permease small subunit